MTDTEILNWIDSYPGRFVFLSRENHFISTDPLIKFRSNNIRGMIKGLKAYEDKIDAVTDDEIVEYWRKEFFEREATDKTKRDWAISIVNRELEAT